MRIIIEMTEAEDRRATVHRERSEATEAEAAGIPAVDGGPPSPALLYMLGAAAEPQEPGPDGPSGEDAGSAPAWLEEIMQGIERAIR